MLPVAILAGGLATRLGGLTRNTPKALLQIANRPFIAYQLELLHDQGIERVVLCVGHLGEQIAAAIGNGRSFGLTIEYSFDGAELLGTGGALRQALPRLGTEFFVAYGDSYLPCRFTDVEAAYRADCRRALMVVLKNSNRWDRSNVSLRGDATVRYDKRRPTPDMEYIDAGLSILSAPIFDSYPPGKNFDLADVLSDLGQRGQLSALEIAERFYEIGSPQGLADTARFFAGRIAT
jgi:N-acetyl-alpha-D-muramate 1-phosphate uridylyltransferase